MVNSETNQDETISGQEIVSHKNSSLEYKPFKLLKFIEPLITENIVKEIDAVYEFHIIGKFDNLKQENKREIFHLDIKNNVSNRVSIGIQNTSKTDCIIKLTEESLNDLLADKLKPFTAYLSGKIEIEGDLNSVFKLKKLIKLLPSKTKTFIKI